MKIPTEIQGRWPHLAHHLQEAEDRRYKKELLKLKTKKEAAALTRIYERHMKELLLRFPSTEELKGWDDYKGVFLITGIPHRAYGWTAKCKAQSTAMRTTITKATGYGYCRDSTALAEALNHDPHILQRLFDAVDESLGDLDRREAEKLIKEEGWNKQYRTFPGYGCDGYRSPLPRFEGGVGVSSLVSILEEIGYEVTMWSFDKEKVITVRNDT